MLTSYIKTDDVVNVTRNTAKIMFIDGEDFTDIFNDSRGTLIAANSYKLNHNQIIL